MTDGMDEVMAAVDAYAAVAAWGAPDERKAVEQAVARLVLREKQAMVGEQLVVDGTPRVGLSMGWQVAIDYWRVLAGEQEPARSDGGTE